MNTKIGIAGGGQLGRLLTDAAHELGASVIVLDPTPNSPAGQVADVHIVGEYTDADKMRELASVCDVLTFEVETVNAEALEEIAAQGHPVHPQPRTLSTIKDKLTQKTFLRDHGIPVAAFTDGEHADQLRYPYVLKARSGGFDGRGNILIHSEADIEEADSKLKGAPAYAEGFVNFEKELAVVAARTVDGVIAVYPVVETVHRNHICHEVLMPAPVPDEIQQKARALAEKVLSSFEGAGVFAIEMFLVGQEILVNEVAPRVHNSGHLTIEACETSQFKQHILAITGESLGSTEMKVQAAVMLNILGGRDGAAEPKGVEEAEKIEGVKVHIYGKMETRRERKMGHLTAVADTLEEAKEKAERAHALISI